MNLSSTRNHKFEARKICIRNRISIKNKLEKSSEQFLFYSVLQHGGNDIQCISNTCSKTHLYNFKFQK